MTTLRRACMYCDKTLGYKDGNGTTGTTHDARRLRLAGVRAEVGGGHGLDRRADSRDAEASRMRLDAPLIALVDPEDGGHLDPEHDFAPHYDPYGWDQELDPYDDMLARQERRANGRY